MVKPSHAELHAEHRLWSSEHAMWRDDINIWREEIQRALADLGRLEETLREHDRALDVHLETIGNHVADEFAHEQALASAESSSTVEDLDKMTSTHQKNGERHLGQREAHERIKKHHHSLIARWSLFLKALQEAM